MHKRKEGKLETNVPTFQATTFSDYSVHSSFFGSIKTSRFFTVAFLSAMLISAVGMAKASTPVAGTNVRVTVDTGSTYRSADQLAGSAYTDAVLQRCGVDRRMQNEPTLAIDPRNTNVWASGANDYCPVPTAGDA